jgi:hypothetical protein
MIVEARIKEVSIPIGNGNAKTAYRVEYNVKQFISSRDIRSYNWYFHSIYLDKDLAEYVKAGIEDQSIQVAYVR